MRLPPVPGIALPTRCWPNEIAVLLAVFAGGAGAALSGCGTSVSKEIGPPGPTTNSATSTARTSSSTASTSTFSTTNAPSGSAATSSGVDADAASEPSEDAAADVADGTDPDATLAGTEVAFSVHCCSSPPNASNQVGRAVSAVVTNGSAPEFPATGTGGSNVIAANITISSHQISIVYAGASQASGGAFNGYEFAFSALADGGVPVASILDATLDPTTTFKSGVTVTFDAADVFIDVAGLGVSAQSKIVVDLTLGPPAVDAGPEADAP
jgi:hypothetical protein